MWCVELGEGCRWEEDACEDVDNGGCWEGAEVKRMTCGGVWLEDYIKATIQTELHRV